MAYVQARGARFWVEDQGQGTPVVFSHSLFFDGEMFSGQAAALAGHFRVIRYDHRGQGRSDPGPRAALTIPEVTADAAALIEAIGCGPCHFVGNSMGGFVALHLAATRPDLLLSATALGSSGEAEGKLAEFAPLVDAMAQGIAPHVDTVMHIMFGDSFLADPARAAQRAHWRAKIAGLPTTIADAAHGVIHRPAVLEQLAGTRVKVLAVAGAEDHAYSVANTEAIARAAGGRSAVVPRAGHSVALEEPDAVNTLLRAHFAGAVRHAA